MIRRNVPGHGLRPSDGGADPAFRADPAFLGERLERAEQERELYLGLLNLSQAEAPLPFVERALGLIVEIVGAERGYLELVEPDANTDGSAWWTAAGCSDEEVQRIRETVSRGIIAHAVAAGQAVSVPSALLDPRFRDRASVKRAKIEAVLCVPIGGDPPLGVVYLQGRANSGPYPAADVKRVELFARHLVPVATQFFRRQKKAEVDVTSEQRRRLALDGVVGHSEALARLFKDVELAAKADVSLLISGETGTGKSQIARVIHQNTPRRGGPFMELNCAAIPETLLESELFGAMRGAHATATTKIEGKVAAAHGGTLFLDEIAELSLTAQAKLLQLLQTKEYYPLGSSKALCADIRVIAATNADLREHIKKRTFREDLYFRLSVLPLRVPSLAERVEDIPALAEYFCEHAAARHKTRRITLSASAIASLKAREWPGNVRELSNTIEASVLRAMAENGDRVTPAQLFPDNAPSDVEEAGRRSFQEETRRFQCNLLEQVLTETDWNITRTARDLDLTRGHVYNLIKAFELSRGSK